MGQAVAGRLNGRSDERGPHLPCECGGEARFAGRRNKTFTTDAGARLVPLRSLSPAQPARSRAVEDSFLSPAALRMIGIAAARTS